MKSMTITVAQEVPDDRLAGAYEHCLRVARGHYENFPVASWLLPARLRPHIAAVYAFARHADDLADRQRNLAALLDWRDSFRRALTQPADHPILLALSHTVHQFQLPVVWLENLLQAFQMDLEGRPFDTWEDLLHYCTYSANPVGRIVLWLSGYRREHLFPYSDAICSALQLTNFWQDVAEDLAIGRIYLPRQLMNKHQITEAHLHSGQVSNAFRHMMAECIAFTRDLFQSGRPLLSSLRGRLRWEIRATLAGGERILHCIEKHQYDIFHQKIRLSLSDWLWIAAQCLTGRIDEHSA